MFSTRIVKAALWGLVGALLCAYPVQADMFVVAGGGKSYKNVVVVAKSGSPYTSVQAALDAISGASDSNRYLIFVAPGTYDGRFTMEPYVDIVGSGPNVTILQSPGGGTLAASATCTAADNATLSDLTLKNTGGDTTGIAFYSTGVSPTLSRLRVEAGGASSHNYGLSISGGSPYIKDSTIIVSQAGASIVNTAVSHGNSHATYQNCDIGAYYGSDTRAMFTSGSSEVNLQNCRLGAVGATTNNYGMYNTGLGLDMVVHHSQITANGEGTSATQYGVFNTHGIHMKMFESQVESRSGAVAYGVANGIVGADSQIEAMYAFRCSIQVGNASGDNVGVLSFGDSDSPRVKVYLNQCDIEAATHTISAIIHVDTYVGACWLNGGAVFRGNDSGTITCAGCYDEDYTFYPSACP